MPSPQPKRLRVHVRELLKTFPELSWSYTGGFFYLPPVNEILVGYIIEPIPYSPRLSVLCAPLYVGREYLHFRYTQELETWGAGGLPAAEVYEALTTATPVNAEDALAVAKAHLFIGRWDAARERAFAQRVATRIAEHLPRLAETARLDGFARMVEGKIGALSRANGYATLDLALTYIMLGRLTEARSLLRDLPRDHLRSPAAQADFEETVRSLDKGEQAALDYRRSVMQTMRERLGVTT